MAPSASTDTRFPRVNYKNVSDLNPAAVLYAKQEFVAANPKVRLQDTEMDRDRDNRTRSSSTGPTDYFLGDRAIYVKALKAKCARLLQDGHYHAQGMNSALNMLATFNRHRVQSSENLRRHVIRRATYSSTSHRQ